MFSPVRHRFAQNLFYYYSSICAHFKWSHENPTKMRILLHGQLLDELHNDFGEVATDKMRVKMKFQNLKQGPANYDDDDVLLQTFNILVETSGKYFKLVTIFCSLTCLPMV